MTRAWRDTIAATLVALVMRGAVAAWAKDKFPAIADGFFYDTLAHRVAHGHGYTWLWKDGAVTFAAHYPAGYPLLLALFYALFGDSIRVAVIVNAIVGAIGAGAAHRVALHAMSERAALVAALLVALHPALVLYTPAIMTEGVTTSLVILAAAFALSRHKLGAIACGVALGVATLVRPQCALFAPLLGVLCLTQRLGALVVTFVCAMTCAPWVARNCTRMKSCSVSENGGWNLLIGTQTETGTWVELASPPECATVWDEAGKNACFGRAARAVIARDPAAWLAKAPRKLAATFDFFLAGPYYLNAANESAFSMRARSLAETVETIVSRGILLAAILALARRNAHKRWALALGAVGIVFVFVHHAWPAYVILAILCTSSANRKSAPVDFAAAAILAITIATHAAFFGAGRYGLLVVPVLCVLACTQTKARRTPEREAGLT